MEKSSAVKPKNRLLKLAASAVTFQNPPFSPSKEKRSSDSTHKIRKGFSGPMISIIPAEARYKSRTSSFAAYEPTSPKISCMGQIKHKKKMCSLNKQNHKSLPPRDHQFISHSTPLEQVNSSKKPKVLKSTQSFTHVKKTNERVLKSVQSFNEEKKKKNSFVIRNIFAAAKKGDSSVDRAPSLGQMQRFSSGRNSLSNFDWTAVQIAPVETDHERNYHSDEERESDGEEELDDCKIAFSAPILIGGCKEVELEPRKEINLWKRRTMAQPKPLQVNSLPW